MTDAATELTMLDAEIETGLRMVESLPAGIRSEMEMLLELMRRRAKRLRRAMEATCPSS